MFWHHDDPDFDNPPGNNVQGPVPLDAFAGTDDEKFRNALAYIDWHIIKCRECHEPIDEWHLWRLGKPIYISCKWDRRISVLLSRARRALDSK